MKPVTELYEAAEHEASGNDNRLMSALGGIDVRARAQGQSVSALLGLLDLVSMLPPERLGLVRWVVGLSELDLALLRAALLRDSERLDTWAYREHAKRMAVEYQAALSGGEGGAKCQVCHGDGYHSREVIMEHGITEIGKKCGECDGTGEGGAKAVHFPEKCGARGPNTGGLCEARMMVQHREHYAPATNEMWPAGKTSEEPPVCTSNGCASCGFSGGCDQEDEGQPPPPMWGAVANAVDALEPNPEDEIRALETRLAGVREKIRSYDGGDRPSSPPMALFREEQDLLKSIEAKEDERDAAKPTPTILPAGKPPPFLRVGMVLKEPTANRLWTIQEVWQVGSARCTCPDAIGGWWACDVLRTWTLAEDFAVEGES